MKKFILIISCVIFNLSISAQVYKGEARQQSIQEKLNKEYCSGLFQSADGTILNVADSYSANSYINILNWMQGRVAGLQVFTSRTGISIPVIRGSVPGVYVDEMPVPLSFLQSLNVNDIAIVKVIKTPFYGGFNGGGGAIAIYTLKGDDEEEEGSE